jgi:hypothetical protein
MRFGAASISRVTSSWLSTVGSVRGCLGKGSLRVTNQTRNAELHAVAGSEIRAVVGIDLGDKRR